MLATKGKTMMSCRNLCFVILIVCLGIGNGESNGNLESQMKVMEINFLKMNQAIEARMEAMESNFLKMNQAFEQIQLTLESMMGSIPTDAKILLDKSSDLQKMNDTDLENRVLALEFQMENVQEDVSNIEAEVTDIEGEITNIEGGITIINADVSILSQGQLNQDEKIEDLEDVSEGLDTRVTTLENEDGSDESVTEAINQLNSDVLYLNGTVVGLQSTDIELDSRLETLEEVDVNSEIENLDTRITTLEDVSEGLDIRVTILEDENGSDESVTEAINQLNSDVQYLNGTVVGLQSADIELDSRLETLEEVDVNSEIENLDSRLDSLELDGTLAFHVGFTDAYPVIPRGGVAVWDYIFFNLGDGYNSVTGEFVVPIGGAGLYYFNIHFLFDYAEIQWLNIRHNGESLCWAYEDNSQSGDFGGSACGAVVQLAEGDAVDVYHENGSNDTPCQGYNYRSTFSGFRIAPA